MDRNRTLDSNSSIRLRAFWESRGSLSCNLSNTASTLIASSWRATTEQCYSSYWKRWIRWTTVNSIPPTSPTLAEVLNFLADLYDQGLSWQYIGGARSVLSSTLSPVDGFKIGDHPSVSRLVKGVLHLRPPIPRLVPSWSVSRVLRKLGGWPSQRLLSLKQLTIKTVLLLVLASAKRVDSISKFMIKDGFMEVSDSMARIQPYRLEKNSRVDHLPPVLVIPAFYEDPSICPVFYLKAYLRRTNCEIIL